MLWVFVFIDNKKKIAFLDQREARPTHRSISQKSGYGGLEGSAQELIGEGWQGSLSRSGADHTIHLAKPDPAGHKICKFYFMNVTL